LNSYIFQSGEQVVFKENWINSLSPSDAIPTLTLRDPFGPVTRVRAKRLKKTINKFLQNTWAKVNFKRISKIEEHILINLVHVQEGHVREHPYIIERLE